MSYRRILTIQDISCVGQCSLTVALPILSACGIETAILPSAVLSTHTGGFSGNTFRDLTEDIPAIEAHWNKEGIRFDAFYTGYLGNSHQIDYVLQLMDSTGKEEKTVIVDPAMADNGKLYSGFDEEFVQAMKRLYKRADYLIPNLTEACLLTGQEYRKDYDKAYVDKLLEQLHAAFTGTVILTGVSYQRDETGVVLSTERETYYYRHRKIGQGCHGTGDIFASAFTGALLQGISERIAIQIAADYTASCIEMTLQEKEHWYGVKFEPMLPQLIKAIYQIQ